MTQCQRIATYLWQQRLFEIVFEAHSKKFVILALGRVFEYGGAGVSSGTHILSTSRNED